MLSITQFIDDGDYTIDKIYVDKFWNTLNDKEWVFLSDDLIQMIGFTENKNCFRLMKSLFNEEKDYLKISSDESRLLKIHGTDECHEKIHGSDESRFLKAHGNKKTYKINTKAFKKLLLKANTTYSDKIYDYYIQLEEIFFHYTKYQSKYQLELKDEENKKQLLLKDEIIKEKDSKILKIQSFINNVAQKDENEYIYIATTEQYAINNQFKIGFLFFYLLNLKI